MEVYYLVGGLSHVLCCIYESTNLVFHEVDDFLINMLGSKT